MWAHCTLGVVRLGSGCLPRGTALRVCARCLSTYRYTIAIHLHIHHVRPIVDVDEHCAVVLATEEISLLRRCAALVSSLASRPRTPSQQARILCCPLEHVNMTAHSLKPSRWGKPSRKSNGEKRLTGRSSPARRGSVVELSSRRSVAGLVSSHGSALPARARLPVTLHSTPSLPDVCRSRRRKLDTSCIHERDVCQHVMPSHAPFGSWGGRILDLRHVVALQNVTSPVSVVCALLNTGLICSTPKS